MGVRITMVFICINDVLPLHLVLVYCCVIPITVITCTHLERFFDYVLPQRQAVKLQMTIVLIIPCRALTVYLACGALRLLYLSIRRFTVLQITYLVVSRSNTSGNTWPPIIVVSSQPRLSTVRLHWANGAIHAVAK